VFAKDQPCAEDHQHHDSPRQSVRAVRIFTDYANLRQQSLGSSEQREKKGPKLTMSCLWGYAEHMGILVLDRRLVQA
jgi:hypothetical protein